MNALELIVGVLLAGAAVWFVLRPVLRPEDAATFLGGGGVGPENEGDDPDDDVSPRAVALRALREIEFDRATGKLSDADYDALKHRYTAEALAALRASPEEHPQAAPALRPSLAAPNCPDHGPRPEPDALFCSECGRRLGQAPDYCQRCGTALEPESRYCGSCGSRVAA